MPAAIRNCDAFTLAVITLIRASCAAQNCAPRSFRIRSIDSRSAIRLICPAESAIEAAVATLIRGGTGIRDDKRALTTEAGLPAANGRLEVDEPGTAPWPSGEPMAAK